MQFVTLLHCCHIQLHILLAVIGHLGINMNPDQFSCSRSSLMLPLLIVVIILYRQRKMIEALYKIIQTGYADLVQEIDPQPGVIDILFSKEVLNHEEKVKLQKTSGDQEKVRFILDKLKYKPDQAYSIFREAVLKDQPHLEKLLPLPETIKKDGAKGFQETTKSYDNEHLSENTDTGARQQRSDIQTISPGDSVVHHAIIEILDQSGQKAVAVADVERKLCKKLTKCLGHVFTFKDFYKQDFLEYLLREESIFSVNMPNGKDFVVSRKPKWRKMIKKKGLEETPLNEGKNVKKTQKVLAGKKSGTEDIKLSQSMKSECTHDPMMKSKLNPLQRKIEQVLMNSPGNTTIFRESGETYMRNRQQFMEDIVSLRNTPREDTAYIIIGVKAREDQPHKLVGLEKSMDGIYQAMFQRGIFQPEPDYTYRETNYKEKLVGVLEIDVNHNGGPSIVISNDMAPTFQKNQIWARLSHQNMNVSDADKHKIFSFFQCSENVVEHLTKSITPVLYSEKLKQKHISSEKTTVSKLQTEKESGGVERRVLKKMADFKKGHFVLVCGTIGISCKNVVSLSKAPWVAVCDFDFYGRDCGLLGMLEESIKKKRSLSLKTWCHAPTSFGEKSTQWWCLRGRRDEPDSIKASEASTHVHWYQCVRDKVEKLCQHLTAFTFSYTILNILVLWPSSELEAACTKKFLETLQLEMLEEEMKPKLVLCLTEQSHAESLNVKSLQNDFKGDIETFCIDLGELCSEINLIFENDVQQATNAYLLPAADGAEIISLSEEDYAWLKQDLEILFLQNPYPVKEKISSERETFFRGGSLPWHVWYLTEEYSMDVKRSSSDEVKKHIEKTYIQEFKRGIVTISHAPGSGGSTMAQRILWDLHKTAPCVQVRLRSGSPMEELAERLRSLCSKTHLPVVALIDGEDMPRLKQLSMLLQDTYVVILHVQRYPFLMSDRRKPDLTKSEFILRGTVTKQESSGLVAKFSKVCDEDQKKTKALNDLNMDVQEGIDHQMYEYGMTVFSHEFKGVRSYVKGYLQLEQNVGEMLPWQKCVGFLSLVFYYGHTSMPCQFFSRILGYEPDVKLDIDDLPSEMTVFVVPDTNEGRGQHIRIIHYIIAKEILEQILNRVDSPPESHGMSERLSYGAKRNLKKFCLDFISHTASKNRKGSNLVTAQSIVSILTRTFIFRDNKYDDDTDEAETSMKKKGRNNFSQIVNDVDAHPPFTGRIEVVEKLCEAFPGDPNFRAHLGRIYSFCRPEQEKEIEKHFQIALKLCNDRKGQRKPTEIEDSLKLTLMHVYHMYGMVFVRRISKYVDKSSEVSTQKAPFDERLDEIIRNAVKACEYFELSRSYTQPGCEDTYTYIDEIRVRLKACAFIQSNFEGGLTAYLSSSSTDKNKKFVTDSVVEIEDLIMECHSVLDTSDMSMLYKMENWFRNLFMPCTSQLMAYVTDNDLNSLRLNIMVRKLNVTFSDNFMSVEHKMPPAQVNSLVKDLEIIICNKDMPKRRLEVTYLNWLSEIRNPNCKVYNLETVLEHVRNWRSTINSPKSTLYLFIIQSLIGFGSKTQPGNTECLTEALELLRGEILKKRSLMFRPKYPREWLGRLDIEGIRRLVPSKAVEYDTHRKIKDISRAKLATCKGTIRQKNDNKLAGYVDLDLHGNGSLVEVFYIPVRAGLEGSRYAGYRVQFHLAFTMEHGYEAFEVELLKKYQCHKCPLKVEIMRDEDEAKCRCGAWIAKSVYTEASDDS